MKQEYLKDQKEILPLPELYEKYSADIFRYSFSILKDSDEAKDAVQETFVKYAEKNDSFRGECSQKTWLLIITRNYCYNRRKSRNFREKELEIEKVERSYNPDFDLKISLENALNGLSPEENEMIYLREYENYSYKEITEIMGLSLENVKIKIFRTREKLRKILKG